MDLPVVRRLLAHPRVLVSLIVLLALVVPLGVAARQGPRPDHRARFLAQGATQAAQHTYTRFTADADFARGKRSGVQATAGTLRVTTPRRTTRVGGQPYQVGTWRSPWVRPGHAFTELVPSWNARTPGKSWLRVQVRVADAGGRVSTWKSLGRWAVKDRRIKRRSAGSQADAVAQVATDTVKARGGVTLLSWQVRVRLAKAPRGATPRLASVGAVVSSLASPPATSAPLSRTPVSLPVPGYSQMTHRGQNPEYGGGGEAWCSPTALAMLLGYYGRLPAPASYAWVPQRYADRWVNQVARLTYDYRYHGTGNWPFNTAAAGTRLPEAFVTRVTDLRAAEPLIRAGIPLIVSIRFSRGQLTGAPITSTPGHLVVLSGFDARGNPVVHDPAAATNATVRRTYDRAQFERAWLGGSGGTAYVLRDAAHPLPPRPSGVRSW